MKKLTGVLLAALIVAPAVGFAEEVTGTNVVWKNSVALGATFKSGNTDQTLFTMNIKSDRYSSKNDWINSLYAEYGKTSGEQTEGQVRLQSDWRHKFAEKNFFGGVFAEGYTDALKSIRTRLKIGPNIGYYWVNEETMKFDTSFGINYVYERTAASESDFAEYRAAANFLWDFTETASYYCNVEYSAAVEDTNDGNGLFITGLKNKMTDQLSLFIELRDEYDNLPDAGIEHNDVIIMAGLGYDF